MSDLVYALTTLGLRHTAAHLDDVVALATKRRWSLTQFLDRLVHHAEIITIEGESYRRRVAAAKQKSSRVTAST